MTLRQINLQSYYLMKHEIENVFVQSGENFDGTAENAHAQRIYDEIHGGHEHDYSKVTYTQSVPSSATNKYTIGTVKIDNQPTTIYGLNTEYSNASASQAGLMSKTDKDKLDKLDANTISFSPSDNWSTSGINTIHKALENLRTSYNTSINSINGLPTYTADQSTGIILSDNNVFSIAPKGIGTTQINDKAITTDKIADGVIVNSLAEVNTGKALDATKGKELNTAINSKAPKDHADTNGDYGKASKTKYGHVKIITDLNTEYTDGLALSASAGQALSSAISGKAPKKHTSSNDDYGKASSAEYGHVKLSDSYTNTSNAATGGTAASSKAVNDAYTAAYNKANHSHPYISTSDGSITLAQLKNVIHTGNSGTTNQQLVPTNDARLTNARTPTSHASNTTTYGVGTASNYGHVKLSDDYTTDPGTSSGVAASNKAVYDIYDTFNGHTHNTSDITDWGEWELVGRYPEQNNGDVAENGAWQRIYSNGLLVYAFIRTWSLPAKSTTWSAAGYLNIDNSFYAPPTQLFCSYVKNSLIMLQPNANDNKTYIKVACYNAEQTITANFYATFLYPCGLGILDLPIGE